MSENRPTTRSTKDKQLYPGVDSPKRNRQRSEGSDFQPQLSSTINQGGVAVVTIANNDNNSKSSSLPDNNNAVAASQSSSSTTDDCPESIEIDDTVIERDAVFYDDENIEATNRRLEAEIKQQQQKLKQLQNSPHIKNFATNLQGLEDKLNKLSKYNCNMANQTINNVSKFVEPAKPQFVGISVSDGKNTTAEEHIKLFERCASTNCWSDAHKLSYFGTFLHSAGQKWYTKFMKDAANGDKEWDDLKLAFLEHYGWRNGKQERNRRLRNLRQGVNESIKDYYFRILEFVQDDEEYENSNRAIQELFENGLNEKFLRQYDWFARDNMTEKEFKEMVIRLSAPSCESNEKANQFMVTEGNKSMIEGRRPRELSVERKFERRPQSPGIMSQRNISRERNARGQPRCYNCGRFGHFQNGCPNLQKHNPSNRDKTCFNCGKLGHLKRDCRTLSRVPQNMSARRSPARVTFGNAGNTERRYRN